MDNLVSVIIPSFKRTDTLKEAILSVCNQTYKNFEIIVVNDCGIDTKFIVDEIRENYNVNIKYIRHEKNRGLSATRNTGIKNAKGDYIAFLDDDDIFYQDHLETLINALKENTQYKIAYTAAKVFTIRNNKKIEEESYNFRFSKERFFVENYIPVNAFMIKKEIFLKENFWFDENLRVLEDYDLWIRLSQKYEFLYIPKFTCEVRRVDKSLSKNHLKMYQTKLYLYEKYPLNKNKYPELYSTREKVKDEFQNAIYLIMKRKENLDKISIIVPCINNTEYLKKLFDFIKKFNPYLNKELLIVNSNTNTLFCNEVKNLLSEDFLKNCDFNYKFFKERYNLPKLLNQGAYISNGKFLIFLINAFPGLYSFTSMVRFYELFDNCGIIGGKTLTNQTISLSQNLRLLVKVFHEKERFKIENNQIERLDMIYSHILFISKKDFYKIDGFNENLDDFSTVLDFTSKIKEIGKFVYYNPFSECVI